MRKKYGKQHRSWNLEKVIIIVTIIIIIIITTKSTIARIYQAFIICLINANNKCIRCITCRCYCSYYYCSINNIRGLWTSLLMKSSNLNSFLLPWKICIKQPKGKRMANYSPQVLCILKAHDEVRHPGQYWLQDRQEERLAFVQLPNILRQPSVSSVLLSDWRASFMNCCCWLPPPPTSNSGSGCCVSP